MSEEMNRQAEMQAMVLAKLPRELAMVKIENDQLMSASLAHPRDLQAVVDNVLDQVRRFPAFARKVIYCKPVGKDRDSGKEKYAKGLSIRAAEALAEALGFNRIATDVTVQPDGCAKITVSFTDIRQGRVWTDSAIVPRSYKNYKGVVIAHQEDRYWNVVVAAQKSRCIREAVLRSVPPALREELYEAAEKAVGEFLTPEQTAKLLAAWASKGITEAMIVARLEKPVAAFTGEDRVTLQGMWQAMQDGEVTLDECFPTAVQHGPPADMATRVKENAARVKAAAEVDDAPSMADFATPPVGTDPT